VPETNAVQAARAQQLARGVAALSLNVSTAQQQALLDFVTLLYQWNRTYNLTAIPDNHETVALQLLDSLALLPFLPLNCHLLDIGSGGGLPGLPLAIARPTMPVTLLDSNGKKTRFLTHVKQALQLQNVTVVQERIEHWSVPEATAKDLFISSRALAELTQMVRWTLPMLRAGATIVALKGQYPQAEIEALHAMPEATELTLSCQPLQVPGIAAARHLVLIHARHNAPVIKGGRPVYD
jgi:16S rRNA (guanine527-N7)-methyltransferase